jgi:hypothetical protein
LAGAGGVGSRGSVMPVLRSPWKVCLLTLLYGDPGPGATRSCLGMLAELGVGERAARAVALAITAQGMIRWATW